jgi:F-type H+-transporting ATPase subunit epsilon
MTIDIITPDRKVFAGEATSAIFPGSGGEFQILNDHAPMVSTLAKGPVVLATTAGQQRFIVDGGVVEVLRNRVLVLAEAVELEK